MNYFLYSILSLLSLDKSLKLCYSITRKLTWVMSVEKELQKEKVNEVTQVYCCRTIT